MSHPSDRAAAAARKVLQIVADHIDKDIDLRLAITRYLHDEFVDSEKKTPADD